MLSSPGWEGQSLGQASRRQLTPAAGLTKQREVGAHLCTPARQCRDPAGFHILCLRQVISIKTFLPSEKERHFLEGKLTVLPN